LFIDHQGLLIASPENNASMSALLKNAIDWISREDGEQSGLVPYAGKVAALMAASPSVRGGLRGVPHLRASLEALNVLVLPGYVTIPHADAAFAEDGALKDPEQQKAVAAVAKRLVATIAKLAQ
jgi:NAD(P)H-dependent FMN reductase